MKQIKPLITAAILTIALVASTSSAPVGERSLLDVGATVGNLLDTKIEALGKVPFC